MVRLVCGNGMLCDASDGVIRHLEPVQGRAARVFCKKIKYDRHTSVTELLWGLHWLPIRIQYKFIFLVYRALTSSKPPYFSNMLISKKQMRATRSSLKVNHLYLYLRNNIICILIPKTCKMFTLQKHLK